MSSDLAPLTDMLAALAADQPAPAAEGEVQPEPVPFLAGTFALYAADDGALVLVTDIPGRGQERNVLPAAMMRAAMAVMGGGGKLAAFGGLFSRKGRG